MLPPHCTYQRPFTAVSTRFALDPKRQRTTEDIPLAGIDPNLIFQSHDKGTSRFTDATLDENGIHEVYELESVPDVVLNIRKKLQAKKSISQELQV